MYLGIDPSLNSTGWCVLFAPGDFVSGTIKLTKGKERGAVRTTYIIEQLRDIIDQFGGPSYFTCVGVEGYAIHARGQIWQLAELGGVVRFNLSAWGMSFVVPTPTQVKKFATTDGGAHKVEVCLALQARGASFLIDGRTGHLEKDWRTDEADAYVMAEIAACYARDFSNAWTGQQIDIVTDMRLDPHGVLTRARKEKLSEDAHKRPAGRHANSRLRYRDG